MGLKRRKEWSGEDVAGKKANVEGRRAEEATQGNAKHNNGGENVSEKMPPLPAGADEPDFPRGGASVLTPAEVREAQSHAEAEFQQDLSKQKKGRKGQRGSKVSQNAEDEQSLFGLRFSGKAPTSVDTFRYKSVSVGLKVWGAVMEVNHKDLVISLPGGLRGFVRREEASDVLADLLVDEKLRKRAAAKAELMERTLSNQETMSGRKTEDGEDALGDAHENASLKDLFSVGQLVAGRVIGREEQRGKGRDSKDAKRISLSLRLRSLQDGLTIDAIHEGQPIIACVSSVEDHGYLLTFGVSGISGFLLRQNYEEDSILKRGQLVQGVVLSVDKKRSVVSVMAGQKVVKGSMLKEHAGLTIDMLLPGSTVNVRVRAVLRNGLLLSFLTYFTGTVDMFHMESPLFGSKLSDKYTENQRLKAKILYVDPVAKTVGLTLNVDLLRNISPPLTATFGDIFGNAIVRRIDRTMGMLLELPAKPTPAAAYVHISNVSDERVEKLEAKYSEGKKVKARIIGFRMLDGIANASMKRTVLDQLLLSHADVKAGMVVHGTITLVEAFGAIARLDDNLKGLCPVQHMSEYGRVTPSPKFKVGARLKFRVLQSDVVSRKITLTHKKTLVSSRLNFITSYEDAMEGLVSHGWITGIMDYGCFVGFYNDVRGLATRTELGLAAGANAETAFQLGQCVKCRVLRSDPSQQRISLSFVTSMRVDDKDVAEHELKPGSVISGTIVRTKENSLILDVSLSSGVVVKGILPHHHLSDNPGHIEQKKILLKPGYTFDRLLVLEKGVDKVFLSAKFSLLESKHLPTDISQLREHGIYQGYITNITERGCFVRFLARLTGLASIPRVADAFVSDASKFFTVGQSVRAHVIEVQEEVGKFNLSLKQSVCGSSDASLLQGYFVEEEELADLSARATGSSKEEEWSVDLAIGHYVEGEVQDVKAYGVIVNVFKYKEVIGFVTHYQRNPVEVGTKVKARVLDVVKGEGIVDLTLRPGLFSVERASSATLPKIESKKRTLAKSGSLELHMTVAATVELVKDEYLVLSLPDHDQLIAFAATRDYNSRTIDPQKLYHPGQRLTGTVQSLPHSSTGGRLLLLLTENVVNQEGSQRKKARKNFKCEPGSLIEGEIIHVDALSMTVAIGRHFKGTIHISEVWDEVQDGHPFGRYEVGQTITAKVLARIRLPRLQARSEPAHFQLSVRPSELAEEGSVKEWEPPSFNTVEVGEVVMAYVQEVHDEMAWLVIGPHMRGRLHVLDSSTIPSELSEFKERFQLGKALLCRIARKDGLKRTLDLSLNNINTVSSESQDDQIRAGMVMGGRVSKILPEVGGLSVQVSPSMFGRVHVTQISDVWEDHPEKRFREGQFVTCVVLQVGASDGKRWIDLSLRPSLGGSGLPTAKSGQTVGGKEAATIETLQDLSLGLWVQAYVKIISKKGCFVTLSRSVDARILLSELSDTFVADPFHTFSPGKVVKGRVASIEPLSGRVEMSLKTSDNRRATRTDGSHTDVHMEDFKEGDIISGQIRRIESFGIFIAMESSNIVGMCHVSEISDGYVKNVHSHCHVGQSVRAKVLKMDLEKQRVSLGLKHSYLGENVPKTYGHQAADALSDGNKGDSDSEGEILEESDQAPKEVVQSFLRMEDVQDTAQDNDDLRALAASLRSDAYKAADAIPPLQVDLDVEENDSIIKQPAKEHKEGLEIGEVGDPTSAKEAQRAKKRLKKDREAEIKAAEEKRLLGNQAPETIDEFEQLVRASPNSSYIWIKYMAFMLSMADVDRARQIAERALEVINFREEGEKLNVWVAYLNLENAYGSDPKQEAVLKVFQKAQQYCDTKKLHLALLGIYERTEQHNMADELVKTMIRKFKSSSKVWLRKIQNLLKRGMDDAAQKCFQQSLLSLPQRKHVKVISQVAIMEFKIGSSERARTIFEGIVRNYPRRTDLWSVYLDQEISLGDVTVVRALFERAISLELPPKKIKFLFKKYLDFEKSHGDESRAEYVRNKAMEYVEAKLG